MPPATILIIDDEYLIRWSLGQRLASAGFDVVEAGTIAEARLRAASTAPALIVLDQRLPDGDGLALLAEWRSGGVMTPVILISAHLPAELAVQALACGATDIAPKPFQLDALLTLVRQGLAAAGLNGASRPA